MGLKKLLLLFFVISLFMGCANIQGPSGGDKDTQPPEILRINPPNTTTDFNASQITFHFDEYIQLTNPSQQVFISPPFDDPLDITQKRKRVTINLPDNLKSNTTYTINFGESIKDLNEGNAIPDYQYIFSTGEYIDSAQIKGQIRIAQTGKPAEKISVILYRATSDSAVFKENPYYLTRTDENGNYRLAYLHPGMYKIIALEDLNRNYQYEPFIEKIAYSDTLIKVDTQIRKYDLFLFMEEPQEYKIMNVFSKTPGQLVTAMNKTLAPGSSIQSRPPIESVYLNRQRDTVYLWYKNSEDSIHIDIAGKSTVSAPPIFINSQPLFSLKILFDSILYIGSNLILKSPAPLRQKIKGTPVYRHDSLQPILDTSLIQFKDQDRKIEIPVPEQIGKNYRLQVPQGAFTDIYGRENDSLSISFDLSPKTAKGTLVISFSAPDTFSNYIVLVYPAREEEPIRQIRISPNESIRFPDFPLGTYTFAIVKDLNRNNQWDTGIYMKRQPEPVYTFDKRVQLKPDWEANIDLQL